MTPADALSAAVAAEDAAVYAYGVLGPRLAEDQRPAARIALDTHRQRSFALRDRVAAAGGPAPDAPVAYDLPFPVTDPESAGRLAGLVEMRLAAAYADLAAALSDAPRTDAVLAAREATVRAIGWGSASMAFPGIEL
jgi:hypothetical protein